MNTNMIADERMIEAVGQVSVLDRYEESLEGVAFDMREAVVRAVKILEMAGVDTVSIDTDDKRTSVWLTASFSPSVLYYGLTDDDSTAEEELAAQVALVLGNYYAHFEWVMIEIDIERIEKMRKEAFDVYYEWMQRAKAYCRRHNLGNPTWDSNLKDMAKMFGPCPWVPTLDVLLLDNVTTRVLSHIAL